jgi:pre-mRNA cleavage complex 2 protein Pcf11
MRGGKRQRLMSPTQPNFPSRGAPPPGVFDLAALTSRLNPDIIRTASAQGTRASATPPPVGTPASGLQPPPAHLPANPLSKLANSSLPGSATPPTIATNIAQFKMLNENAFGAYEHHCVHFTVQLQSSDIARYRPGAHALLYDAMPLRCGQCGNRYLDCPLGKERLDRDLDRHLRISRRYTESTGAQRGIARSWFTVEEVCPRILLS